jgi:hypothetical protein
MKKIVAIIILLCLFSCTKSKEEVVTSHQWKYGEGYHVGDWIDFSRDVHSYSNDTIFKNGIPVGLVDTITTHYGEYRLYVKSFSGGKKGLYFEKGKTSHK